MTKKRLLRIIPVPGILILATVVITLHSGKTKFGYSLYRVEQGWGYDITVGGKAVIHQPFVPAIEGVRPFPDEGTARGAAHLVVGKMQRGEIPALTVGEVDSLLRSKE